MISEYEIFGKEEGTFNEKIPDYRLISKNSKLSEEINKKRQVTLETPIKMALKQGISDFFWTDTSNIKINEVNRMENAKTKPFQLNIELYGQNINLYLKKFCPQRIIGIELQNILSGNPPQQYQFNLDSIIEQSVWGRQVTPSDIQKHKVGREMIKLDVLGEIIGISDLAIQKNSQIDESGKIFFFDYDDSLKTKRQNLRPPYKIDIEGIKNMEKTLMFLRAIENKTKLIKIIDLVRFTGLNNEHANEKGYVDSGKYLEARLNTLGDWKNPHSPIFFS